MTEITAVILAAGLSRRMGTANKLLRDMDGEPMVRRTVRAICESQASPVIVVLGHESDAVKAALSGLAVETILNPDYEDGQVSSVRTGLAAAGDGALGVMMCLADQPLLATSDYNTLMDAFRSDPGCVLVPVCDEGRGNPVIVPATMGGEVLAGGINFGCRDMMDRHPERVRTITMDNPAYFQDFDTPEIFSEYENKKMHQGG